MRTTHLIQYDCVSQDPSRACDPEAFDPSTGDYIAESELQLADVAPVVGQVVTFAGDPGTTWVVTDVSTYDTTDQSDTQVYHLATCTQDGVFPAYRHGWDHNEPMYLSVYTDLAWQPTNPEGYDSESTSESVYLPQVGDTTDDGFVVRNVYTLKPQGSRLPWGYDAVTLCRCVPAVSAVTV